MDSKTRAQIKERISFPKPTGRLPEPSIFDVIEHDPTLSQPLEWRQLQIKDQARWTRRYLLPVIKVWCLTIIWITKFVKRVSPIRLGSERCLNWLSTWFMKTFVSPEAQQMLYRHFALENALVHFVIQNSGATDVDSVTLRPTNPEQLGDTAGMNATLMHDQVILNLFVDLGKSQNADVKSQRPLDELDYSALYVPDFDIKANNPGRVMNLDMESCIYITVMVLGLFFDDDTIENSVNSLFLDESLMKCLTNITGDDTFRYWTLTPFTDYVRCPFNPAEKLYEHIRIHEYAYHHLTVLKAQSSQSESPAEAA